MNADQFNSCYGIGTPVFAYPGARPEDIPSATRLVTRTRTAAQAVGLDREGVVWVEGHGAYIALTHVDPVTEAEWKRARTADAVAAQGALPMPVGAEPRTLDVVEEELTGANLSLYEEELENARLRLALKSAQRGRRELRSEAQFLEPSRARWRKACIEAEGERDLLKARVAELEAERHSTNEALSDAAEALREQQTRIAELEKLAGQVRREDAEFLLAESRKHASRAIFCDGIRHAAHKLTERADASADRLRNFLAPTTPNTTPEEGR